MKHSQYPLFFLAIIVVIIVGSWFLSYQFKNMVKEQVLIALEEEQLKRDEIREEATSELLNGNPFYAHIIQVGGNFSNLYSIEVFGLENGIGQYYLNPPNDFVNVSLARGGDSLVIIPSELSRRSGYVIDKVSCNEGGNLCHFAIPEMRNEIEIKFTKE